MVLVGMVVENKQASKKPKKMMKPSQNRVITFVYLLLMNIFIFH